jgi:CRISPR-associated protein Cas5d
VYVEAREGGENMEHIDREYCLEVAGDYACFTRPEFKVERVSYDIITPSAVRAIFSAVFWKPAIRWIPTKIELLSELGQWASIRRNEVGARASTRSTEIFIEDYRQQKASQILRDVHYRIYSVMEFIPLGERSTEQRARAVPNEENPGKYQAIFERRAKKGQVFMQPYLGCREFSCTKLRFVEHPELEGMQPLPCTRDLGIMLYDMDFSDEDNAQPMFFRARVENGVVLIPGKDSKEVMK